MQAQDYASKTTADVNDPKYSKEQAKIKSSMKKLDHIMKKKLEISKPDQKDLWIQGLYRIYYNLNLGKEFEEIDKLMNNISIIY